jgi:hypothetical protein
MKLLLAGSCGLLGWVPSSRESDQCVFVASLARAQQVLALAVSALDGAPKVVDWISSR